MGKKIKPLTREEFLLNGGIFEEPFKLSLRSDVYYENYEKHMAKEEAVILCKILMHPFGDIFTKEGVGQIRAGFLEIGGKKYIFPRSSNIIASVLISVWRGIYNQNEVLFDACKKLSKHESNKELDLIIKVYNYLEKDGYLVRKKQKK